jgi:hypothetical protein
MLWQRMLSGDEAGGAQGKHAQEVCRHIERPWWATLGPPHSQFNKIHFATQDSYPSLAVYIESIIP